MKNNKIIMSLIGAIIGTIIVSELLNDSILIRIWYTIIGAVCGVIFYMFIMKKINKNASDTMMKDGDVTNLIIKRDLVKQFIELSAKIDSMNGDIYSIRSILTNGTVTITDDTHDILSNVSGKTKRLLPTLAPVIGPKPSNIQISPLKRPANPTTQHEESVGDEKPMPQPKPFALIPSIKQIARPSPDDVSPDELARFDMMPIKPIIKLMKPRVMKPAAPRNIDHYDDTVIADDPDSEE